jgi:hypothetical protein
VQAELAPLFPLLLLVMPKIIDIESIGPQVLEWVNRADLMLVSGVAGRL